MSFEGMENYGLVTCQVLELLFDESSSAPNKQREVWNITHKVPFPYLFSSLLIQVFQNNMSLPYLMDELIIVLTKKSLSLTPSDFRRYPLLIDPNMYYV
jgi:hypothetical protein